MSTCNDVYRISYSRDILFLRIVLQVSVSLASGRISALSAANEVWTSEMYLWMCPQNVDFLNMKIFCIHAENSFSTSVNDIVSKVQPAYIHKAIQKNKWGVKDLIWECSDLCRSGTRIIFLLSPCVKKIVFLLRVMENSYLLSFIISLQISQVSALSARPRCIT